MAVKIITDSTSDIFLEEAEKLGVEIVPLKVNFSGEVFIDKFSITSEQFYEKLESATELPTTTLVNPGEFLSVFNKYPDDDIVGIFISSKLSGTFQSACIAKQMAERENIYVIDSTSATVGLALLVKEAVRLEGENHSAKDIYNEILSATQKLEVIAVIDTLKYLVMGGRISSAQGFVGNILGIKPLIMLKDGVIENIGKERGTQKAIKHILHKIKKDGKIDKTKAMAFAFTKNPEDANLLSEHFDKDQNVITVMIGSVVGTHVGPGAIGMAYFRK